MSGFFYRGINMKSKPQKALSKLPKVSSADVKTVFEPKPTIATFTTTEALVEAQKELVKRLDRLFTHRGLL